MRFLVKILIIVVVCSNITQANQADNQIFSQTLDNGLHVLILEKHTMPVVAVQVWYNVGSIDEPNGLKGIAHLFEHMMFRGSKNYGPEEHFKLIRAAGGQCNAYTSDEQTVYHERLPADKLELALKLEADRMAWLKLDQNVLDTERQVVLEEYRMYYENDPMGAMYKETREFLFPENGYRYGPIGKKEDIENFTVKNCQDFYNKYYAPNNATLIIAGDVEAEKAIKMVEEIFGEIKPSKLDSRSDFEFVSNKVKAVNKGFADLPVPVMILSFYTEGARDRDRAALQVLINCLTNGRSSRLWKTLINDKKVAEFFAGENLEGAQNGVVILGAAHLPGLSKKVEKNIWKQLEEIKAKGLNESEFVKTRNQMRAGNVFQKYHAERLASSIGFEEIVRGDYTNFYRLDEEIATVTQEDVIRVANRYFNKENVKKIYFEPRNQILLVNIAGLLKSIF